VLAFSVSARTREFGVRLAIGSTPAALLTRIVREGAVIGIVGIVAGAIGGVVLARLVSSYIIEIEIPGVVPIIVSALVLVVAAVLASVMPGARASRVDIISALRAD
jgi:ABC-type antimicrobial peptide transport system permease subunit